MDDLIMNPLIRAALIGTLTAAAVDFQTFRAWKSLEEAKTYAWGVAAWRWFLGAITGVASGFGLGAVFG